MAALLNCRRWTLAIILFFLILFGFASTGEAWIGWVRVLPRRPRLRRARGERLARPHRARRPRVPGDESLPWASPEGHKGVPHGMPRFPRGAERAACVAGVVLADTALCCLASRRLAQTFSSTIAAVLLMIDCMFLDDDSFLFEPSQKVRAGRCRL